MEDLYRAAPQGTAECDYQAYDKIWQRVAPDLEPYPEVRGAAADSGQDGLLDLPGAQGNPCCMGTQARESLGVIRGFIEEEQMNRQFFCRFARCTQDRKAARLLQKMGEDAGEHLRQLLAVYYLTTGECFTQKQQLLVPAVEGYCAALRRAYHEKVCSGFNYMRAADATGDLCLQKIFQTLGEEEMTHARLLLKLLARRM